MKQSYLGGILKMMTCLLLLNQLSACTILQSEEQRTIKKKCFESRVLLTNLAGSKAEQVYLLPDQTFCSHQLFKR